MADGFEPYESRPMGVRAKRVWIDTDVHTPEGYRLARAGSWIVVARSGDAAIYPDDVFREGFQPTSTAAEAIWKENPGGGLHPVIPYKLGEEPEST